jgi:hypothetical protein
MKREAAEHSALSADQPNAIGFPSTAACRGFTHCRLPEESMAKKEHCPNCGGWLPAGVHAASVKVSSRTAQPPTLKAHACNCPEGRTAARGYETGSPQGPSSRGKP